MMHLAIVFLVWTTISGNVVWSREEKYAKSIPAASKPLKILVITPPAWGHLTPLLATAEELVLRGHEVTLCVGVDDVNNAKFKERVEKFGVKYSRFDHDILPSILEQKKRNVGPLKAYTILIGEFLSKFSADLMHHLNQSLGLFDKPFDIVLGNNFVASTMKCVSSAFGVPSVILGTTTLFDFHLEPPWAWPGAFHGAASDNMPFRQRVVSVVRKLTFPFLFSYLVVSPSQKVLDSYCPGLTLSDLSFSPGNSMPYIVPTVIGFDYSRTQLPLIEYVGPLMVKSPAPLSEEIGEWLAGKPERSVVYVSMGSWMGMDERTGRAILEGVMRANYSLLWSLRKSNQWILDGLTLDADRVLLSEWTPQFSVLQSTAIHSAILHGGFNGLNEALWNGVPVIGLPQMAEQVLNIGRVTHNGLGLRLDSDALTSSEVMAALATIDSGDYIMENIRRFQKILRFSGGARRAADLVEHYEEVGYAHLIPSYIKYRWNWIQYYNVDVYAAFVMVLSVVVVSMVACLRCMCCQPKLKVE